MHVNEEETKKEPVRKKRRQEETKDDDPLAREWKQLISKCLEDLQIPSEALSSSQWSKWTQLKHDPHLPPSHVRSDVSIRLFHQFLKKKSVFQSTEACANHCQKIIQQELQDSTAYHRILNVASCSDPTHGDQLVLQTHEAAIRNSDIGQAFATSGLCLLYEDEAIAVVDKPANMLSVDGKKTSDGTSVHAYIRHLYPEARMVHRLDFETSGLLVIALTKAAAQHLNMQFRSKTIVKTYHARVQGLVTDQAGEMHVRMRKHPTEKLRQQVVLNDADGVWSTTKWKVLSTCQETQSTLMELQPVTGKTHQLRVHMEHLGHPILGDSIYSAPQVQQKASRLLLHAYQLVFQHPVTNTSVVFTSPCTTII